MQHVYGKTPLDKNAAAQCSLQIIGDQATGTCSFVTGFYGLPTMPTEFQRIKNKNFRRTYTFIDDILIVTKGTETDHWAKVRKVLERLDRMNIRLKLENCEFVQREAKWLGFHFPQTGNITLNSKVQGNTDRLKPKNLKELRPLLGAVKQMNRLIPNLAQFCFPFRSLLKIENN